MQHDVRGALTHPKLGGFHLCATTVADNEAVRTARDIIVA